MMERVEGYVVREQQGLLSGGVLLISLGMLLFEISLVRIFSVILTYHYVFVVVSLSLFGLGLGGIFVHLFRRDIPGTEDRFRELGSFAFLSAVSVSLVVSILTRLSSPSHILLYGGLMLIPFFFAGGVFSSAFRMFPGESSRIYGADLIGAAGGCILALWLLSRLGGVGTGLFVGMIISGGAFLFAIGGRRMGRYLIGGLMVGCWFFVHIAGLLRWDVPVADNPEKDMYDAMHQASWPAEIAETRWSAFGRTDLVRYTNFSDWMALFIDGEAGTNMYRFNGDPRHPDSQAEKLKNSFSGYFPFFFLEGGERVLTIGPGGGRDVLGALLGGAGQITAVEVNRDMVEIVREYSA
ncbi:MAG: hypothetical protein HY709_04355, partial [Candidatus Latescibacteria bacterium]|nr:hypothetical protein [Candidatus Latescibacterota bacterium]